MAQLKKMENPNSASDHPELRKLLDEVDIDLNDIYKNYKKEKEENEKKENKK